MHRELTEDGQVVDIPATIGEYSYVRTIGQGNNSVVILTINKKTQQRSACKVVPRTLLQDGHKLESLVREIENLQSVRHPNIIEVQDVLYADDNIYIFMEYCEKGELLYYVIDHSPMPLATVKKFFFQLCSAIQFMHDNGIAHRDIKPENILLNENLDVKVADLGFSKRTERNVLMDTPCGSPYYVAPEVLDGRAYDGTKSDIWSLGVLLFGISTGALPWTAENQTHLFSQILHGQYVIPDSMDRQVAACIERCLRVNPCERPTAAQLLRMPLLRDVACQMGLGQIDRRKQQRILASSLVVRLKQGTVVKPVIAKSSIFRKMVLTSTTKEKPKAGTVKPGLSVGTLDQYRIENVPEAMF